MSILRAYADDFAGWAEDTARAIAEGRFEEIDQTALADEVASLSRSARRQLTSALRLLLTHLLKAQHQPEKHTRSWDDTIRRERRNALTFLKKAPASRPSSTPFCRVCPWTEAEILGDGKLFINQS